MFGILKQRFRCLLFSRQLHYSPDKVARIANVCCALHNICIHFNVPFKENVRNKHFQPQPEIIPDDDADDLAKGIRNTIKNLLTQ